MSMDGIEVLTEAFRCSYCHKLFMRRYSATRHLTHCWKNPNRQPQLGELTSIDYESEAPWHPLRPGLCYTDRGWQTVPGYKREWGMETWPEVTPPNHAETLYPADPGSPDAGIAFDKLTNAERIECWDALIEQYGEAEVAVILPTAEGGG